MSSQMILLDYYYQVALKIELLSQQFIISNFQWAQYLIVQVQNKYYFGKFYWTLWVMKFMILDQF